MESVATSIGRGAKFAVQRFGDLGVGTSPQVNRLLFKNQDYKQFVDKQYLIDNNYVTDNTYNEFVSIEDCAQQDKLKEKQALEDKGAPLADLTLKIVSSLALPKAIQTQVGGAGEIDSSFFRFNDEVNVPFTNPLLFNFLHMFKYTLTKSYSKFRFWRTYRILDGLMDILTNTYYLDDNTAPAGQVLYKNTYLYALRRKFTNEVNAMFGILSQKGDEDLQVKKICANESIKSFIQQAKSLVSKTEGKNLQLDAMNEENSGDIGDEESADVPSKGGYTKRRRHFDNKTRKIKGGFVLYTSRLYRILNMHLDTSNIYNYGTNPSGSFTASVLGTYNKLANTATKEQVPVYVVKEQIRFLLLALAYLTNKTNETFNNIIGCKSYEQLTMFISGLDYGTQEFNTLKTITEESLFETKYNTFISSDQVNIHSKIFNLLEITHGKVNTGSTDITYVKKIFTHAANLMFYKHTENLFQDPTVIYPNLKDKLNKYYESKGLKAQSNGVFFTFATKKQEPYKNDVLEFLDKFVFCLVMTPHFTCSQITGFVLSSVLNTATGSTEIISKMVNASLAHHNGVISNFLKIPLMGLNIGTQVLQSMINTPNCYMSMALMMYILCFSIKPLMPQEGMAEGRPYIFKSDRLNSFMYKPVTSIKNLSATLPTTTANTGTTMKDSLKSFGNRFNFTRKGGKKNKKTRKNK